MMTYFLDAMPLETGKRRKKRDRHVFAYRGKYAAAGQRHRADGLPAMCTSLRLRQSPFLLSYLRVF